MQLIPFPLSPALSPGPGEREKSHAARGPRHHLQTSETRSRLAKTAALADLLRRLGPEEIDPAVACLRFARVKRYRKDKTADEADTVETVRKIFQTGRQ